MTSQKIWYAIRTYASAQHFNWALFMEMRYKNRNHVSKRYIPINAVVPRNQPKLT